VEPSDRVQALGLPSHRQRPVERERGAGVREGFVVVFLPFDIQAK